MEQIISTKLFIPPVRPELVHRPRLVEKLNQGLHHRLALISAPAGSGKTTLVIDWISSFKQENQQSRVGRVNTGWISLEDADNDPLRFLAYFITVLRQMQVIDTANETRYLSMLQPAAAHNCTEIMKALVSDISIDNTHSVLILDDYHLIESRTIMDAVNFFIEHMPPGLQIVIVTREDPEMPLGRLRVNDHLSEIRAVDLRFTADETTTFLNQVMDLKLSEEEIIELDNRTEGWAAGLQLAAISMQGQPDPSEFIRQFSGSHHFVMDYLVEEVLQQQSEDVQNFLLHTSCLPRLCGPLCDAVLRLPAGSGQKTLEFLTNANLFLVPLDHERRWYRYHHLFGELLRQRLRASLEVNREDEAELHRRASDWFEKNGDDIQAFHHAVASGDIDLASRLLHGRGMPLQFRGAINPVLNWLASLPAAELDRRPSLWVMFASSLSMAGHVDKVEEALKAAETALQKAGPDEGSRNLYGHIAAIRALLAATRNDHDTIIQQSNLALEQLDLNNVPVRTATTWKLGVAYQLQGKRADAEEAFTQAISICQKSGNTIIGISALSGLGNIQESQNQLRQAAASYQRVIQLAGGPNTLAACEALFGLARIHYQWNDLAPAMENLQLCLSLLLHSDYSLRPAEYQVFLARLLLARGEITEALDILNRIELFAQKQGLMYQIPELGAVKVQMLLEQDNLHSAHQEALLYKLPFEQARVALLSGDIADATQLLAQLQQRAVSNDWQDELLKVIVLQAMAFHMQAELPRAFSLLGEALAYAKPEGMMRVFIDEGENMFRLLQDTVKTEINPLYTNFVDKLLMEFSSELHSSDHSASFPAMDSLIESLSQRELEILRLIASGLSNQDISKQLFLALSTVKGHNKRIFNKLQAKNRTEAVANARDAGLI